MRRFSICSVLMICILSGVSASGAVFDAGTVIATGFDNGQNLRSTDMNGDGRLDLVSIGVSVYWWENTGSIDGPWTSHYVCPGGSGGSAAIDCGDLDGDGDVDFALSLMQWKDVDWIQNQSGDGLTWSNRIVLDSNYDGASCVRVGDLDGDGDNDLVFGAGVYEHLTYWLNNGTGGFSPVSLGYSELGGHQGVDLADLDSDGDLDIIDARHEGVSIHLNSIGQATPWTYIERLSDLGSSPCATSGDFDNDGDLDVLAAGNSGEIVWYENELGDASQWSTHSVATGFVATWIIAEDLDGDGDQDFSAASETGNSVIWWENLSSGSGWQEHVMTSSLAGAFGVHAADLDDDGDLDLMATGSTSGEIVMWENMTVPEPSTLVLLGLGFLVLAARGLIRKK